MEAFILFVIKVLTFKYIYVINFFFLIIDWNICSISSVIMNNIKLLESVRRIMDFSIKRNGFEKVLEKVSFFML